MIVDYNYNYHKLCDNDNITIVETFTIISKKKYVNFLLLFTATIKLQPF